MCMVRKVIDGVKIPLVACKMVEFQDNWMGGQIDRHSHEAGYNVQPYLAVLSAGRANHVPAAPSRLPYSACFRVDARSLRAEWRECPFKRGSKDILILL